MEKKIYKPTGVCSKQISFEYEDGKMHNLAFIGGCNGNLKAIAKLCEGMELTKIVEILEGNTCGFKNTSCADQLTKAIKEVL
ncbi:MAG: TIGR03905 family TSCPD domain-containing protein [Anaeroplasmataceae bacterium]